MDKLVDYVQWMGDFPISMTGFRDADALVKDYKEHNEGWL